MTNAANKTVPTGADVDAFVEAVADPAQRSDARTLVAMLQRLSGEAPYMWGSSIVGFGTYHYRYDSGREGDAARIAFSPRAGKTVVYVADGFPGHAEILARLGKVKTGKSCLYIKRLSDADIDAFEHLVTGSLAMMAERYPD